MFLETIDYNGGLYLLKNWEVIGMVILRMKKEFVILKSVMIVCSKWKRRNIVDYNIS